MSREVRVKKVSAYPIATQVKTARGLSKAQILKLTPTGFLAEVAAADLQAGEHVEVLFDLPVLHQQVHERGVVIKLYNHFAASAPKLGVAGASAGADADAAHGANASAAKSAQQSAAQGNSPYGRVMHIAEIHFKPLSEAGGRRVKTFLQAISKPTGSAS